ncbi:MAG: hypothetical protein GF368_03635 [Candidatus Aenigmarchaeota archaeon]|nr:hypothetical protein [Candidatus Aenigmarchaeota archaeon]
MHVLIFTVVFLVLDVLINLISLRTFKLLGIDFLFFASWLAGINYGIGPGIVVSLVLLAEHTFIHFRKSKYIALSFPAQIISVVSGYFLGVNGFFISLGIYQVINSGLMLIVGGLGPFFLNFLVINSAFNVILYRIWLWVV